MGVGQLVDLLLDRPDHGGVAMPEAGDRGPAGGVEISAPILVDNEDAVAADGDRVLVSRMAVKDVAHRSRPCTGVSRNGPCL